MDNQLVWTDDIFRPSSLLPDSDPRPLLTPPAGPSALVTVAAVVALALQGLEDRGVYPSRASSFRPPLAALVGGAYGLTTSPGLGGPQARFSRGREERERIN